MSTETRERDDDKEAGIREYVSILLRRWWVIAAITGAAGVIAFVYGWSQVPVYEATTVVMVEQQNSTMPTAGDLDLSARLAQTYRRMITTRPILEQVGAELDPPMGALEVRRMVSIGGNAQLLEISVRSTDPALVAAVANRLADVFITDTLEQRLAELARLEAAATTRGITNTEPFLSAQLAALGSMRVLEPAVPPTNPERTATGSRMLIVFLGLLAGVAAASALEYLDNRLRSPDQAKAYTGLPLLGSVPWHGGHGETRSLLEVPAAGDSVAGAYGFIKTNLEFLLVGSRSTSVLLVTSPSPHDGKTTNAACLAISLARDGRRVVLVDADLRRPALGHALDLAEERGLPGLTSVLLERVSLKDALIDTGVPNLRALPSGPLPPDPIPLLRSTRFREVLEEIGQQADFVILDSPPVLAVADPLLLSTYSDAVVLVLRDRSTHKDMARRAVEAMERARGGRAQVMAVIWNAERVGRGNYYYYHYYNYYRKTDGPDDNDRRPIWRRRLGRRSAKNAASREAVHSGDAGKREGLPSRR